MATDWGEILMIGSIIAAVAIFVGARIFMAFRK